MEVIRDEELGGIWMIPLLNQWGITVCNVENCEDKATTILTGLNETKRAIGICEKHYQEAKATGKFHFKIIFNKDKDVQVSDTTKA